MRPSLAPPRAGEAATTALRRADASADTAPGSGSTGSDAAATASHHHTPTAGRGWCRGWSCAVRPTSIGVFHADYEQGCCVNCVARVGSYVSALPAHARRAASALRSNVASPSEVGLIKANSEAKTECSINLIAWRRSALFVMLFASVASAALNTWSVYDSYLEDDALLAVASQPTLLGEAGDGVPDGESFPAYTLRIAQVGLARMLHPAKGADFVVDCVVCGLLWAAAVLNYVALEAWSQYRPSRRALLLGWACTFLAPFIVSMVPIREFVDFDAIDPVLQDYADSFRTTFHTPPAEETMLRTCAIIRDYAGVDTLEDTIETVCALVDDYIPNTHIDINLLFQRIDVDGRPVHEACADARALIAAGEHRAALQAAKDGCAEAERIISSVRGGNAADILDGFDTLTQQMRVSTEVTVAFINAFLSFKIMAPAAIALAPALVRGSMKCKALVPQSSVPGIFIVALPFLYCPLVWALYNFVFQLVGSAWLLGGLLLLAYSPMMYAIVGTVTHVTSPMDDGQMKQVLGWISLYSSLVTLVAYALLYYYFFHTEDSAGYITRQLRALFDARAIASLAMSTLSKYLFTTLAGVDWMIGEVSSQRSFEVFLESGHSVKAQVAIGNAAAAASRDTEAAARVSRRRDNLQKIMADRTARLDDLRHVVNHRLVTDTRNPLARARGSIVGRFTGGGGSRGAGRATASSASASSRSSTG